MGGDLAGVDAENSKYYGDVVIVRQGARASSPAGQGKNGVLLTSRGEPTTLIYTGRLYTVERMSLYGAKEISITDNIKQPIFKLGP